MAAGKSARPLDQTRLGQVFTPPEVVDRMLALRRFAGRVLEPACGDGAFSRRLPGCTAIEIDPRHAPPGALNLDFFAYPPDEKFASIIGNPPYVRFQDIEPATRRRLPIDLFDTRSNLFLFFIEKCLRHLTTPGELIFITPRDFLKLSSAVRLNQRLFALGTITDFIELGDSRVFSNATPNCAIWRFESGNLTRQTRYTASSGEVSTRCFQLAGGHIGFVRRAGGRPLADLFTVKVGAVSGADAIFTSERHGTRDFVCSHTAQSGRTRRMIFNVPHPALLPHKERLLARRICRFDESNWWQWGRLHPQNEAPRIYVNGRTRNPRPFFLHPANDYDGAVLALFPHDAGADLPALVAALNAVDWEEQGFVCGGRFLFTQRSLQSALLPDGFAVAGV